MLLLKRKNPPFIWAPPGGHLGIDEDPKQGLLREVKEETNLDVEILAPVDVWFGVLQGEPILSLDFLVSSPKGELQLSPEHEQARWFGLAELRDGRIPTHDGKEGFLLSDLEKAFQLYRRLVS